MGNCWNRRYERLCLAHLQFLTIVVGHFLIGRIYIRLIAAGVGNAGFQIVRHDEKIQLENEIFIKLKEAELEARATDVRYSHLEVFGKAREQLANGKNSLRYYSQKYCNN